MTTAMWPHRSRIIVVTGCVVALMAASGCTQATSDPSTTSSTTTTTDPPPTTMPVTGELAPPMLPDPDSVANEAVVALPGYPDVGAQGLFESDALTAIRLWLPTQIVAGTSARTVGLSDSRGCRPQAT